jgi:alpha-tubulin suppressor-like RCC1 family protein
MRRTLHICQTIQRVLIVAAALGLAGISCGLKTEAATTVDAWGGGTVVSTNYYDGGQSIVPAGLTNAVLVKGGWRHSLALTDSGDIVHWGDNSLNQGAFPSGIGYISIACGWQHSLALLTNGTVAAAGDDTYGQIETPAGLSNVVAIACGYYHSLALKADGTVVAWGTSTNPAVIGTDPNYGQPLVPAGLSKVVAISGGGWHSLVLLSDGTLRGWGRNDFGQASIPPGLSNVVAIGAGAAHSVALKADGTVVAWGYDYYQEAEVPAGLSNVVSIAAGGWHNLALKNDGTVVAWGASGPNISNSMINLGQNIVPNGLTNVIQIAAGAVNSLALVGSAPPVEQASLVSVGFSTNGFSVSLPTRNGRVYRLEFKASLTDTAWNALPLQAGTGGLVRFTDPGAASGTQRFYRVRQW